MSSSNYCFLISIEAQQQQEAKQDPEALALPLDWRSMVGEKEATAAHWPSRQHRCRVEDRWY